MKPTPYTVHLPEGDTHDFELLRVEQGIYRLMDVADVVLGALNYDEFPDDVQVGWLLRVEERPDGSLRLLALEPDPSVEYLFFTIGPPGLATFGPFRRFGDRIMEPGGCWQLIMGGLFAAWVPKEGARATGLDIHLELDAVLALARSHHSLADSF